MAVEPLFGDIFNQQPEDVDPKGKAGFTDYVTDVPIGILRGASQAVQGLLSLGAMPVDYLADTNLLSAIDNLIKGGAGQAVQNMNLRFGINEYEGLK